MIRKIRHKSRPCNQCGAPLIKVSAGWACASCDAKIQNDPLADMDDAEDEFEALEAEGWEPL